MDASNSPQSAFVERNPDWNIEAIRLLHVDGNRRHSYGPTHKAYAWRVGPDGGSEHKEGTGSSIAEAVGAVEREVRA